MVSKKSRRKPTTSAQTPIRSEDGRMRGGSKATLAIQDSRVARRSTKAAVAKLGSKRAVLVEQLCRPSGAGIADLVNTLGWLPHTVRAAVTGVRKKGFVVTCTKDAQGQSVYRATPPVKESAKPKSSAKAATTGAA